MQFLKDILKGPLASDPPSRGEAAGLILRGPYPKNAQGIVWQIPRPSLPHHPPAPFLGQRPSAAVQEKAFADNQQRQGHPTEGEKERFSFCIERWIERVVNKYVI
jgi:hypothetical protein